MEQRGAHPGDGPGGAGTAASNRASRRGVVLAAALEASAISVVVALVGAGSTVSTPLVFLALVAALALSTNRDTLFPSELAATADAAVLVCAVVVFRDDSPVLAPALLGLVSGWLDRYHWRSRASVRMAFNSGKGALASLAAAGAVAALAGVPSPGPWSAALAALAASAAFVVVDSGLLVVLLLVVRPGTSAHDAFVSVARVDRWSPWFALVGAAIGLASEVAPWWLTVPALGVLTVLLPTARRRRPSG